MYSAEHLLCRNKTCYAEDNNVRNEIAWNFTSSQTLKFLKYIWIFFKPTVSVKLMVGTFKEYDTSVFSFASCEPLRLNDIELKVWPGKT